MARDTPTQLRWPPHHHGPANQLSFSSKWLDDHHHGHRHQRHRCGIKQPWLLQGSISRDPTVDVRGLALRVVDNQENMERKNCASCMAIHIAGGKKGKNPKASIKDYQGLKPLWPVPRPKSITPIQTHPKPTKINFWGMFSPAALQSPRRSRSSLLWSLHFVAFAAAQSMPHLSLLDRRWFRWGSFRCFEKCCSWRLGIWLINIDHGLSKVELLKWQLAIPMSLSEFGK